MTNLKHLNTIANIIDEVKVGMLATKTKNGGLRSRPMATAHRDDDGSLWFFTNEQSPKIDELNNVDKVLITYSSSKNNKYLSLTCTVSLVDDQDKIEELWTPAVKAWFPDGPDDDTITLLKLQPSTGEYWDGNSSSVIQAMKIGKAILTGERYNASSENHATVDLN